MNLLTTVLTFLKTNFGYLFTAVSGAFALILSEIPDEEIADLHLAMSAGAEALQAGQSAEDAFTAGINALEAAERGTLSKLGAQLFQAFLTATAPK